MGAFLHREVANLPAGRQGRKATQITEDVFLAALGAFVSLR